MGYTVRIVLIASILLFSAQIPLTTGIRASAADAKVSRDEEVRGWVHDLGSDKFQVRQRASFSLLRAGARSMPSLLDAVDDRDAEVSSRATDLLLALCQADDDDLAWAARDALSRIAATPGHPAAGRINHAMRRMEGELEQRAVRKIQELGAVIYQTDQGTRVMLGRAYRGGPAGMAMVGSLPHLVSLTIQQTDLKDDAFRQLRGHRELETISVMDVDVGDDALKSLAGLTNLKSLYFSRTRITSQGLDALRELSNLTFLSLQHCRQITDAGLASVSGLSKLKALDLADTQITDAGLKSLKPLRNLELLNLNGTQVSAAGLRELELASLKQLELQSTAMDDGGMDILKRVSPDFNYLNLEGTAVSDAGMAAVAGLKELWYLNVSHTRITDAGLAPLEGLEQLRTLHLSGCEIGGSGLKYLGEHEFSELKLDHTAMDDDGLKQLKRHRFRSLGLQFTRITDKGLPVLKDLEQLDWLYLDGNSISDAGLAHLSVLQGLRGLSLAETGVTEEGLQTLEKAIVKCRITR